MVSLDKAKTLKTAGLKWEPKAGDWYSYPDGIPQLISFQSTIKEYIQVTNTKDESFPNTKLMTISELLQENTIWLPSLSQLLAEIEKRGYAYITWSKTCGTPRISGACDFYLIHVDARDFKADTPEDAAADALLCLLEQEVKQG